MYKLLRITLFALPLAGGVAWAQGSGTSGSAGAPGTFTNPPVTDDTRTPLQQRAGRIDDTTAALPGDATKPLEVPSTVQDSNRTGMPDATPAKRTHRRKTVKTDESTRIERKLDVDHDSTKMENRVDSDMRKDQLNSDK